MLTDESRRRLCEFLGWKWPNQAQFNSWDHEVMPLLAKIAAEGDSEEFHAFAFDQCFASDAPDGTVINDWLMGNFTDPEHTAGLVDEAIVAHVLDRMVDGKKLYWTDGEWREK